MLFLLLAILSSSVLAVVLKYLNTDNTYGVYLVNYCTCALLAFLFLEPKSLWNGDFFPLGLGAFSGLLYLAALIAYGYGIRKSGAVLASVFSRLGVLVPILLSICLYGERPSLPQIAGLGLAVLATVVMNLKPGAVTPGREKPLPAMERTAENHPAAGAAENAVRTQTDVTGAAGAQTSAGAAGIITSVGKNAVLPLLLVLLLNGSSDSMSKVFAQGGSRGDDGLFVFYIFAFAAVFTLGLVLHSRKRLGKKDILFGVLVGVPNFMAARFLLAALGELPAFLVYPTYSVGAIVVISLFSLLLFRERLSKPQLAGVALILAALVLLNL